MPFTVITAPTVEPLSLSDALEQCHAIPGAEDQTISGYIAAAREYVETTKDRALITQTRRAVFQSWQWKYFLPGRPIQSITSLEYQKRADSSWATWDSSNYVADLHNGWLVESRYAVRPVDELAEVNAIRITYVCGYGDTPESVPNAAKNAMRLLIAHWYKNREASVETRQKLESLPIPYGVEALLANL